MLDAPGRPQVAMGSEKKKTGVRARALPRSGGQVEDLTHPSLLPMLG
jgi:hypothetical protein